MIKFIKDLLALFAINDEEAMSKAPLSGVKFTLEQRHIDNIVTQHYVNEQEVLRLFPIGANMFVAHESLRSTAQRRIWVCRNVNNGEFCYIDEDVLL